MLNPNVHIRWSRDLGGYLKCSFTLIELLVALAVIGTIMALAVPVLSDATKWGRRFMCLNNVRQLSIAANLQFYSLPKSRLSLNLNSFKRLKKLSDPPSGGGLPFCVRTSKAEAKTRSASNWMPEVKVVMMAMLANNFFGAEIPDEALRNRFVPALERVIR